jgi:diaminopimelate epimerase
MKIEFTKMQGAGNDFVMLDAVTNPALSSLSAKQLRALADRHFGVGCDQILMVEKPRSAEADFSYRIFNQDGGEVEHCGNGARCFVVFARDRGLTTQRSLRVQTVNKLIVPELQDDGQVRVNMGAPVFDEAAVAFDTSGLTPQLKQQAHVWTLDVQGNEVDGQPACGSDRGRRGHSTGAEHGANDRKPPTLCQPRECRLHASD